MPDREKVITALQHCIEKPCHTNCPYFSSDDPTQAYCLFNKIMPDALALLKEREPRVMTLEEANETLMHGDFVIMEGRETDTIWLGMRGDDNMELASGEYFDFDDLKKQEYRHEYGRSFRFWTSRPTEEQRKAATWDE